MSQMFHATLEVDDGDVADVRLEVEVSDDDPGIVAITGGGISFWTNLLLFRREAVWLRDTLGVAIEKMTE